MLEAMVPEKRRPFCGINPIFERKVFCLMSLTLTPSISISPSLTSYKREIRLTNVDLPHPVAPIIATVSPAFALKETLETIGVSPSG